VDPSLESLPPEVINFFVEDVVDVDGGEDECACECEDFLEEEEEGCKLSIVSATMTSVRARDPL